MVKQTLTGHTSPETAYVVADYPYGFTLRCQIRYWIETKKGHGQRVMSQTTNPKKPGVVWNKPKGSTYSNLRVLYLDEQGYVQNQALTFYAGLDEIGSFIINFAEALTSERDQKELAMLKIVATRTATRRSEIPALAHTSPKTEAIPEAEMAKFENKAED